VGAENELREEVTELGDGWRNDKLAKRSIICQNNSIGIKTLSCKSSQFISFFSSGGMASCMTACVAGTLISTD
jgi:hypothetical protein